MRQGKVREGNTGIFIAVATFWLGLLKTQNGETMKWNLE